MQLYGKCLLIAVVFIGLFNRIGAVRATALIFAKSTISPTVNITKTTVAANEVTTPINNAPTDEEAEGNEQLEVPLELKPNLTGIPQIDYIYDPNLPRELNGFNLSSYPFLNKVPEKEDIDFKCEGLHDGFYASIKFGCQLYHHCIYGIRHDFLCANFTAFDQKTFICQFVSEVNCKQSQKYWFRNDALYRATTTTSTTTTTVAPILTTTRYDRTFPKVVDRRPNRRRRPQFDYYDQYYDDEYVEDPGTSRTKKNRYNIRKTQPEYINENNDQTYPSRTSYQQRPKIYEDDDDYYYDIRMNHEPRIRNQQYPRFSTEKRVRVSNRRRRPQYVDERKPNEEQRYSYIINSSDTNQGRKYKNYNEKLNHEYYDNYDDRIDDSELSHKIELLNSNGNARDNRQGMYQPIFSEHYQENDQEYKQLYRQQQQQQHQNMENQRTKQHDNTFAYGNDDVPLSRPASVTNLFNRPRRPPIINRSQLYEGNDKIEHTKDISIARISDNDNGSNRKYRDSNNFKTLVQLDEPFDEISTNSNYYSHSINDNIQPENIGETDTISDLSKVPTKSRNLGKYRTNIKAEGITNIKFENNIKTDQSSYSSQLTTSPQYTIESEPEYITIDNIKPLNSRTAQTNHPQIDHIKSFEPSQRLQLVKRPFLPSRGGNHFLPRGMKFVGNLYTNSEPHHTVSFDNSKGQVMSNRNSSNKTEVKIADRMNSQLEQKTLLNEIFDSQHDEIK